MSSLESSVLLGPPRSSTTTESAVREPSSLAISRPVLPPPIITTSPDGNVFIPDPRRDGLCAASPRVTWRVWGETPHQSACRHRHSCSFVGLENQLAASPPCRCSHHASDRRTYLRWCSAGGAKKTKSFRSASACRLVPRSSGGQSLSGLSVPGDRSAVASICPDSRTPPRHSLPMVPGCTDSDRVTRVALTAGRYRHPRRLLAPSGPSHRSERFVWRRRQQRELPIE